MALMDILQHYANQGTTNAGVDSSDHFGQVAQSAPQDVVKDGLAQAFRSDQTPPFAQMVKSLFTGSNSQQRAGLLSLIMGAAGPGALSSVLSHIPGQLQGSQHVTPQDAEKVQPEHVEQLAAEAEKHNPAIVDRVSDFYAQHPDVVKTLGGAALGIALSSIASRMRR